MAAPRSLKQVLRARLSLERAGQDPGRGVWLAAHVLTMAAPAPGCVVAGYWPLPGEIDIRPLLLALAGRGHPIVLPHTPAPGSALPFHRWRPGAKLRRGRFGTRHPDPDPIVPDVLLIPLLGFDRRGTRLGYGGGFYDRTLAVLPGAVAIGCGFASQEHDSLPREPHDARLTAVATERGVIRTGE